MFYRLNLPAVYSRFSFHPYPCIHSHTSLIARHLSVFSPTVLANEHEEVASGSLKPSSLPSVNISLLSRLSTCTILFYKPITNTPKRRPAGTLIKMDRSPSMKALDFNLIENRNHREGAKLKSFGSLVRRHRYEDVRPVYVGLQKPIAINSQCELFVHQALSACASGVDAIIYAVHDFGQEENRS
jgi:hypothetical protein